jgi:hypothetical protein
VNATLLRDGGPNSSKCIYARSHPRAHRVIGIWRALDSAMAQKRMAAFPAFLPRARARPRHVVRLARPVDLPCAGHAPPAQHVSRDPQWFLREPNILDTLDILDSARDQMPVHMMTPARGGGGGAASRWPTAGRGVY